MKTIIVYLVVLVIGGFVYKESPWPVYALSENKQYGVFIQPRPEIVIPSKEDRKKLRKGEAVDSSRYQCRAFFFHRSSTGDTTVLWERTLVNKYGPRWAYVTNNGKYVITLDDWGSNSDKTKQFLVVYDSKGLVRRSFSLEELFGEASQRVAVAQWDKAGKTKLLNDSTLSITGPAIARKHNLLAVEEHKSDTIQINLNTLN